MVRDGSRPCRPGRLRTGALAAAALAAVACGSPSPINASGRAAFEVSLAATGDGFAVAWHDTRDGQADLFFRLLDAGGRPVGAERRLTSTPDESYEADIQAAGDDLVVAWYDKTSDGALAARLGLWTRDGEPIWIRTLSATGRDSRNPVARVSGGRIVAAWIEDSGAEASDVWSGEWNLAGEPLREPERLAAAGRTTWNLNAAIDGHGRAWVAFDAAAGTRGDELFLVPAGATDAAPAPLTADDGAASKYPDVAFSDERIALTWWDERDGNQEVYLFVGTTADLAGPGDLERRARRVTETAGNSIGAYVAWNADRVGLVWCDDTDGQHEVYFQPFDARGEPLADATRVTTTPASSLIPAVRPAGDGFAIAWNEYLPPAEGGHAEGGQSDLMVGLVR